MPAVLEFVNGAYRLTVAPELVDSDCFFTLLERARTKFALAAIPRRGSVAR